MALTKCKECGKEISTTANKCPHCGYDFVPGQTLKGCLVLVIIIVTISFALAYCMPHTPN
jgi:ABC-type ATPase with predicted acetyltransferase domain